ncbi:P-loop containing nucleoside triphosphate hydrolase protein [Pelagophyceae sp. CCMP2097]|nr:P-loop containing nucleoside triphosphate hydrolase protein [Pelagophyceae sp. CCMP2097]
MRLLQWVWVPGAAALASRGAFGKRRALAPVASFEGDTAVSFADDAFATVDSDDDGPAAEDAPAVDAWWSDAMRAAAGTPRVVELLREAAAFFGHEDDVPDELYGAAFPFALDEFQLAALRSIRRGRNVVVSAPTGSGKTVVGELAIVYALARGQRVLYTTPLKALSNQKFSDFSAAFGSANVGLSTGDTGINRDAPIVVMTTEVFRNMLYESDDGTSVLADPVDSVPSAGKGRTLDGQPWRGVFAVVFDEFHYINDPQRGTVWEESLISCPKSARIVALSATASNTDEISGWLEAIHGPTDVVESDFRPVPLRYAYADAATGVKPLFRSADVGPGSEAEARDRARLASPQSGGTRARARKRLMLNPDLERANLQKGPGDNEFARKKREKGRGAASNDAGRRRADAVVESGPMSAPSLARELKKRDMLPAIFFAFSRNGCDASAEELGRASVALLTEAQKVDVRLRVARWREANPQAAALVSEQRRLALLDKGVAAHHAGLLPQHKALIEELFRAGLVRCCFATETLAAGVNLPARTTVITALSKRGDKGMIVPLTTASLLQMAGRAGRRGLDDAGSVVIMRSRFRDEGPERARRMLLADVEPVRSRFRSTYGMACALLRTHGTLEKCRTLVERSFGSYLLAQKRRGKEDDGATEVSDDTERAPARPLQSVREAWRALEARVGVSSDDVRRYRRLSSRRDDVKKAAVALVADARTPDNIVARELKALQKATDLCLASVVAKIDEADYEEVELLYDELQRAGRAERVASRRQQDDGAPPRAGDSVPPAWRAFTAVCGVLGDHGALTPGDQPRVTRFGELVAALNGENELLVALAVHHEAFATTARDGSAAEFAALVSTLVCDVREGREIRTAYDASPRVSAATDLVWDDVAEPLAESQLRHGLDLDDIPIRIDDRLAGIVESFADGCEWSEISESTALDHGDLIRLFRRTLDLLRSIGGLDLALLPPKSGSVLRAAARDAARALDRAPVQDDFAPLINATATEDEDDEDDEDDDDDEDEDAMESAQR